MHTKMHSFEPFQKSFSTKLFDGRELQKQKCAAPPADSSLNCDIPAPISNPKQQSNLNIDHSPQSARSGPAPTGDREQVPLRCPVINCKLKWNVNNRSRFIEHIEAHTHPYSCTISTCEGTFTRMSNLNKHRHRKHSLSLKKDLRTQDVLEQGGVHDRIRKYRSIPEVLKLLKSLGIPCLHPQDL